MASSLSMCLCYFIDPQIDMFNFFLHRNIDWLSGCNDVADYLITQMDPKWTGRDGATLLHLACR